MWYKAAWNFLVLLSVASAGVGVSGDSTNTRHSSGQIQQQQTEQRVRASCEVYFENVCFVQVSIECGSRLDSAIQAACPQAYDRKLHIVIDDKEVDGDTIINENCHAYFCYKVDVDGQDVEPGSFFVEYDRSLSTNAQLKSMLDCNDAVINGTQKAVNASFVPEQDVTLNLTSNGKCETSLKSAVTVPSMMNSKVSSEQAYSSVESSSSRSSSQVQFSSYHSSSSSSPRAPSSSSSSSSSMSSSSVLASSSKTMVQMNVTFVFDERVAIEDPKLDKLQQAIATVLGNNSIAVVVNVEVGQTQDGQIVCIVSVLVDDKSTAEVLVNTVNNMDKSDDTCQAGVLCYATDAFIGTQPSTSFSSASVTKLSMAVVAVLYILTLT